MKTRSRPVCSSSNWDRGFYARQFPDVPRQATSDKIYDEAQFEAYRRLGEYAAESFSRPEISDPSCAASTEVSTAPGRAQFPDLDGWFQALANGLLADNDPAFDFA